MKIRTKWLYTALATMAFSIGNLAAAQTQLPHIELLMLNNPNVMAVAFQWPETRILNLGKKIGVGDISHYDIRVSADIVHAFDYHPQAHANGTIGIGRNWGWKIPVPKAIFQGTYVSSIFGKVGVESNMDSLKKYHAQNYTYGVGYEQQIPFTEFMYAVNKAAVPAVISVAVTMVRNMPPVDSSSVRADAGLNWTVPLVGGTAWVTTGEGHWAKNIKPYAYLTSGGTFKIPMQAGTFPVGIEPVAFARYVIGRRPPNYELVDSWEYGFTTSFSFGK